MARHARVGQSGRSGRCTPGGVEAASPDPEPVKETPSTKSMEGARSRRVKPLTAGTRGPPRFEGGETLLHREKNYLSAEFLSRIPATDRNDGVVCCEPF